MPWSREGSREAAPTHHRAPREPLGARRLLVRGAVCLATLALVDVVAILAAGPQPHIDESWRAPEALPSSAVPMALQTVREAAPGSAPVVAFVGASPTWGDGLADGEQTLPARWAQIARERGKESVVVNLAFNGQLVADTGTLARAAARDADVVFVQITYRTFSPAARGGVTRRFPELPRLLGEPVLPTEAAATLTEPTPAFDVTGAADRALRRIWRLYGMRDVLASRLLGAAPDERLHDQWEELTLGTWDEEPTTAGSFDDLAPDEQTLLAEEWAGDAEFELEPGDAELAALEVLAADLAARDATAVVFLAPLNVAALASYDYLDEARLSRNVAAMRRAVERHGLRFVDLNDARAWRTADFIDISHTTASGTRAAAESLWAETSATVGGAP